MRKIIYRTILLLTIGAIIIITYLSIFGIETDKFNNQISSKINNINPNIKVELKKIKLILKPLDLKIKAKTLGSKFKARNVILDIESIETQISLRSLFNDKFSLTDLDISTRSIEVKKLISFVRGVNKSTELLVLENFVKKGYLIADLNLEFDESGNIKDNYSIAGFVKDGKIDLIKNYKLDKIDFIFKINKEIVKLEQISLLYNSLELFLDKLNIKNKNKEFLVEGEITNKNFIVDQKTIKNVFKVDTYGIQNINLSSKNKFSFKIDEKYKFDDFKFRSKAQVNELVLINNYQLKSIFPDIKNEIKFKNHKLDINYDKKGYLIKGDGNILLQEKDDKINYLLEKKGKKLNFNTSIEIDNNPLWIDFLNFKKNKKIKTIINVKGFKDQSNLTKIKSISLKDENNIIEVNQIQLDENHRIIDLQKANFNYFDKENKKNIFNIINKKKNYDFNGKFFNANNLIEKLINSNDEKKTQYLRNKFKIEINVDKVQLDNEFTINNLKGDLSLLNDEIISANLSAYFSNNENLKFTINSNSKEKTTTLFSEKAKPFVKRYKFIKGFDEGQLDYYSVKNNNKSISTLKIYDFKLKEVPALTKLLTLASLQGIADVLSGEGIRFNEFEMNFENKNSLMTIKEIFAIGPAISILMDGYVEKNKLISLRGTLVPATTINKAIGSIPILGKILVGSKTGEGVFGVSFKIKGPPKNLETSVNPIKTLTPRFITRALEKIKKN